MASFGSRLKELRQAKGMNQAELAEIMAVASGTVSVWERDQRKPDFDKIERLCDVFDVTLAYLLGMNDDPRSPGVLTDELAAQYAAEDEMESLRHIARTMTRLSPSSQKIIAAAVAAAYREDQEKGILQMGYEVRMEQFKK